LITSIENNDIAIFVANGIRCHYEIDANVVSSTQYTAQLRRNDFVDCDLGEIESRIDFVDWLVVIIADILGNEEQFKRRGVCVVRRPHKQLGNEHHQFPVRAVHCGICVNSCEAHLLEAIGIRVRSADSARRYIPTIDHNLFSSARVAKYPLSMQCHKRLKHITVNSSANRSGFRLINRIEVEQMVGIETQKRSPVLVQRIIRRVSGKCIEEEAKGFDISRCVNKYRLVGLTEFGSTFLGGAIVVLQKLLDLQWCWFLSWRRNGDWPSIGHGRVRRGGGRIGGWWSARHGECLVFVF